MKIKETMWYIVFDGSSYYGLYGIDLAEAMEEDQDLEITHGPYNDYPEQLIEKLNNEIYD